MFKTKLDNIANFQNAMKHNPRSTLQVQGHMLSAEESAVCISHLGKKGKLASDTCHD